MDNSTNKNKNMKTKKNMKLTKELITQIQRLQHDHTLGEGLIHRLNHVHESILEEQQQTLAATTADPNNNNNNGNNDNTETTAMTTTTMGQLDPNQEYRMHAADYETLRHLYRDTSRHLEHEENLIILILAKLQDMIDRAEDKKLKKPAATAIAASIGAAAAGGGKEPAAAAAATAASSSSRSSLTAQQQQQQQQQHASVTAQQQQQQPSRPQPRISSRAYITGERDVDSLQTGDKVAARVSLENEDEEEDFWILATLKSYLGKDKLEVIDADPGDDDGQPRKSYKLHKKHILPLSQELKDHKPFRKGTHVLAMFPNTTTFYRAMVDQPPSRTNPKHYLLKFEDDEDEDTGKTPSRRVKFSYVVATPSR